MNIFDGLNEEQSRAVRQIDGPLLLLAGAGSGKTKTLTHRIAYLLSEQGIWPNQILAVTFTNKASREMRHRLSELTGQVNSRSFMPWMGTFHGICVRLLRQDSSQIGIASNFVIYDEDDRRGLIKTAMKSLSVSVDQIKPSTVSSIISKSKNDMTSAQDYADNAVYPNQKTTAKIYLEYERLRQSAGALDFDDLLIETVRLLRQSPETRHKYQQQFRHILIDEYQDTNTAQYEIVKSLVNQDHNICVVGDDWQSIYAWRGADFRNILNFERDFPGTVVIKLEQNYRSTAEILEVAHNVISKNKERTDKRLWTDQKGGSPVQVQAVYDDLEEAHVVANRISAQLAIGARKYSDFAVLYRTNAQSFAFERVFLQLRIPYQLVGGVRFYDRKEIKDIMAYLRLIYQPNDMVSFSRIINLPKRGIGETSLDRFFAWKSQTNYDLVESLSMVDQANGLTPRVRQAMRQLGLVLNRLRSELDSYDNVGVLIEDLLKSIKYRDYLSDGSPKADEQNANLDVLVNDAKVYNDLGELLEESALMSSVDQANDDEKVTLMTLHASKGLEFPVVFMVGMEDGLFPSSRALEEGPKQLEEERRLCYVGMTRARQELFLSFAQSRSQFGARSYMSPSRFLDDMGSSIIAKPAGMSVRDDFDKVVNDFDIGEVVSSPQFGRGEIIDIDGLAVTVQFEGGTKKLNIEYARLVRL